jgi:hypothetical protein
MQRTEFPYPPLQALSAVANPPVYDHHRSLHAAQDRSALLSELEAELAVTAESSLASLLPSVPKALLCCASLLVHHGEFFLPMPSTLTVAYHYYHSLMATRVLQNLHRTWPPDHSFERAIRHFEQLRGPLLHPASHLSALHENRSTLADLGVYLSFGLFLAITGSPSPSPLPSELQSPPRLGAGALSP